jgi:DNA-directed RNA polymerase subunit RPC12/RpoP
MSNWKESAVELAKQGISWRKIAVKLNVPKSTCSDYLRGYFSSANITEEEIGAKVLFLDLEVSASIVAAFSMFKHFSSPDHVIQFPYVLTYAANWLHDSPDVVECYGLDDFEGFEEDWRDDFELILRLWNLVDKADIVVAQNAPFDVGWFNQRCAYHNLPEPSPYRVVDTLKGMKKAMSLPSNSLGYTTKYFNLPHNKLHNEGISLWIRCMEGEREAFESMKTYNVGDIPTLRELYLKIRAFIPNHPNVALYFGDSEEVRCPICGGKHLELLEGKAYTNLSVFDAYRCKDCGTVKRSGQSSTTTEERKKLLRQISK